MLVSVVLEIVFLPTIWIKVQTSDKRVSKKQVDKVKANATRGFTSSNQLFKLKHTWIFSLFLTKINTMMKWKNRLREMVTSGPVNVYSYKK